MCLPVLVWGQKDTVIFIGPNGTLEPGAKKMLKKEIRLRGNKKARISTWKTDVDPEVLLFSERITIKKPDLQEINIKGRDFKENITRTFEKQPDGTFLFTDREGFQVKRTGTTLTKIPLLFHGEVTDYYPNGNKKSVSVYENNEMVSNRNWDNTGREYIQDIFYSVDQQPLFVRGTHNLHKHILNVFGESGIDLSQVEGRIVVGFVVMEDGSIDGLRIEKGLGRDLNDLAIQAFNSLPGVWQPARLEGQDVRFYQLFPINFIYKKFEFDYLELSGSMLYYTIN